MGKILVGKVSDITSGKMIMVSTDGKDILVTNVAVSYTHLTLPTTPYV